MGCREWRLIDKGPPDGPLIKRDRTHDPSPERGRACPDRCASPALRFRCGSPWRRRRRLSPSLRRRRTPCSILLVEKAVRLTYADRAHLLYLSRYERGSHGHLDRFRNPSSICLAGGRGRGCGGDWRLRGCADSLPVCRFRQPGRCGCRRRWWRRVAGQQ